MATNVRVTFPYTILGFDIAFYIQASVGREYFRYSYYQSYEPGDIEIESVEVCGLKLAGDDEDHDIDFDDETGDRLSNLFIDLAGCDQMVGDKLNERIWQVRDDKMFDDSDYY